MQRKIELLIQENQKLKELNSELSKKLIVAQNWMKKQIKEEIIKISRKEIKNLSDDTKISFIEWDYEEVITKKIYSFFWDIIIMNFPKQIIEHIISAEINYYNLEKNNDIDGFPVISSYHKTLDIILENFITKEFRKFAKKRGQTQLRKNDLVEKFLNSVVIKWYSLSVWRLYHLLKTIKSNEELFDYWQCFSYFLDKYHYIKDVLLDDIFYKNLWKIVNSEVLWEKRHKWFIHFKEAKETRNILIWDFKNKSCIIYKLVETQNVPW